MLIAIIAGVCIAGLYGGIAFWVSQVVPQVTMAYVLLMLMLATTIAYYIYTMRNE